MGTLDCGFVAPAETRSSMADSPQRFDVRRKSVNLPKFNLTLARTCYLPCSFLPGPDRKHVRGSVRKTGVYYRIDGGVFWLVVPPIGLSFGGVTQSKKTFKFPNTANLPRYTAYYAMHISYHDCTVRGTCQGVSLAFTILPIDYCGLSAKRTYISVPNYESPGVTTASPH